jgi:hypothetical protein
VQYISYMQYVQKDIVEIVLGRLVAPLLLQDIVAGRQIVSCPGEQAHILDFFSEMHISNSTAIFNCESAHSFCIFSIAWN